MTKLKYQPVTQEDLQLVSKIEEQSFNRDFDKVFSLEELKESYDELSKSKGEVKFSHFEFSSKSLLKFKSFWSSAR